MSAEITCCISSEHRLLEVLTFLPFCGVLAGTVWFSRRAIEIREDPKVKKRIQNNLGRFRKAIFTVYGEDYPLNKAHALVSASALVAMVVSIAYAALAAFYGPAEKPAMFGCKPPLTTFPAANCSFTKPEQTFLILPLLHLTFWVVGPPIYFLVERFASDPQTPAEEESFKRGQELATKIWAAVALLIAALLKIGIEFGEK
jgi:hypothetical protein